MSCHGYSDCHDDYYDDCHDNYYNDCHDPCEPRVRVVVRPKQVVVRQPKPKWAPDSSSDTCTLPHCKKGRKEDFSSFFS